MRNPHELGLGMLLGKIVAEYDMKPVLTRPEHCWFTDRKTYIECDVDVQQVNQFSRRAFWHFL